MRDATPEARGPATYAATTVDAGEFPPGRWRARWIWSSPAPTALTGTADAKLDRDRARGFALFRRTFTLDALPDRSIARATADSRYVVHLNGFELGRGPVRGHPQRLRYDTYDLTPHLSVGENVLAVLARFYGRPTPWWMPSTATFGLGGGAVLLEAALGDAEDPDTAWIVSDGAWRSHEPAAWHELGGAGIGDMAPEVCDARALPAQWWQPGFDDTSWPAATELMTNYVGYGGDPHPPTHPYGPLLPRPIPQLAGHVRDGAVIALGRVADVQRQDDGSLRADPVVQYGLDEAATVPDAIAPVTTIELPHDAEGGADGGVDGGVEGEAPAHLVLVDFGQQVAGRVRLVVDAPAGASFDAKAAEARDEAGRLQALQQHSGFRYIARGHDDEFETFDGIGLRYLGLVVRAEGPVTIRAVQVRELLFARHTVTAVAPPPAAGEPPQRSDFAPSADVPWFACSDEVLEDIWRIGRRTVDMCSQDAYLDCPSREQRGWTGDSVVHQLVDLTTNVDWSLARWNVELGASPRADGMLPMAAGGDFEHRDTTMIPDWALHWVHALHNIHRYTGDADFVARMMPVAERVLRWFEPFQGRDGLLDNVTGWVIIDWAAVHGNGKSAALNALWARGLRDFADMADWLGDSGRTSWALDRWRRVEGGFEQFWDAGRERYVDNLIGSERGRATSQHGNAAALCAGLVPDHRREPLATLIVDPERLVHAAWLVPGRDATLDGAGDMYAGFGYLVTGPPEPWWDVEGAIVAAQPFYRYVVHDAIAAAGGAHRIPALCRDWQVLIERCPTSWTETWYGGSYCHGWCATPTRDLMQHTLGVTPDGPGFARARIAPALGDLTWAKGAVPTPRGLLDVAVDRDGVRIDTPIPARVVAPSGATVDVDAGAHTLPWS